MANLVTSLCCVVLAAVVVAYAQRRSQLDILAPTTTSTVLPCSVCEHGDIML
ncbi:putative GPI-anchored protein, partial [Dissostichus eleginoides]